MYLGFGAFLGCLPVYAKAAHLNDGQIALVVGTQLLTALVAKPAAGWLSDRIGRKPVITVGLVVSAASLPLIFRAEGFLPPLLFPPILGIAVGAVTPVTNALVADLDKDPRLRAATGVSRPHWTVGASTRPHTAR